jgi:hypothetical protein
VVARLQSVCKIQARGSRKERKTPPKRGFRRLRGLGLDLDYLIQRRFPAMTACIATCRNVASDAGSRRMGRLADDAQ